MLHQARRLCPASYTSLAMQMVLAHRPEGRPACTRGLLPSVCAVHPPTPPQTGQGWTVTAKGLWLSHQNKWVEYSSLLGQNDGTRGKGARKVRRRQRTSRDAELDVFTAALVPVWGLMSRLGGAPSLKPTRWHQVGVGTP